MQDVPLIKQFLQHQSEFMAYLVAMTREFDAAEEVFQNAAVVIMQQANKQDEIRNFRSWAKEIVRRQALYYLRQQVSGRKHVRPVEPSLLEQINRVFVEDMTDEDILHQEITALRECVRQVTGVQRTMLTMRYEQRASFHAIGKTVGKTEGAVQRALSRLRKALHDCVRSKLLLAEGA
jgi:RNA polymerase sigma-70 factor (ECF subfamily)